MSLYKNLKKVSNFNYERLKKTFIERSQTTTLSEIQDIPLELLSSEIIKYILRDCDNSTILFLFDNNLLGDQELRQIFLERKSDVPARIAGTNELYRERIRLAEVNLLEIHPRRIKVEDLTRYLVLEYIHKDLPEEVKYSDKCFELLKDGEVTEKFFLIADKFDWDAEEISSKIKNPISIDGAYMCAEFLLNKNISFYSSLPEEFNKEEIYQQLLSEKRIPNYACVYAGSNVPLHYGLPIGDTSYLKSIQGDRIVKYYNSLEQGSKKEYVLTELRSNKHLLGYKEDVFEFVIHSRYLTANDIKEYMSIAESKNMKYEDNNRAFQRILYNLAGVVDADLLVDIHKLTCKVWGIQPFVGKRSVDFRKGSEESYIYIIQEIIPTLQDFPYHWFSGRNKVPFTMLFNKNPTIFIPVFNAVRVDNIISERKKETVSNLVELCKNNPIHWAIKNGVNIKLEDLRDIFNSGNYVNIILDSDAINLYIQLVIQDNNTPNIYPRNSNRRRTFIYNDVINSISFDELEILCKKIYNFSYVDYSWDNPLLDFPKNLLLYEELSIDTLKEEEILSFLDRKDTNIELFFSKVIINTQYLVDNNLVAKKLKQYLDNIQPKFFESSDTKSLCKLVQDHPEYTKILSRNQIESIIEVPNIGEYIPDTYFKYKAVLMDSFLLKFEMIFLDKNTKEEIVLVTCSNCYINVINSLSSESLILYGLNPIGVECKCQNCDEK